MSNLSYFGIFCNLGFSPWIRKLKRTTIVCCYMLKINFLKVLQDSAACTGKRTWMFYRREVQREVLQPHFHF